jgi:integrase
MNSKRFGEDSLCEIDQHIDELTPINTKKSKAYTWKQFECFCAEKGYALEPETSVAKLASIMKDFAFNMKKKDGQEYKEGVIKTIWNSVAKILQQKYKEECNVLFDPFRDVIFSNARSARDAKRKQLQLNPEKRKTSSSSLTREELEKIISLWDEETPEGLQRKFYHIASYELAWRGGEAVNCLIDHFTDEINNTGKTTGRIIYNPVFSKTSQGGSRPLTMDKWLIENLANPDKCPVR